MVCRGDVQAKYRQLSKVGAARSGTDVATIAFANDFVTPNAENSRKLLHVFCPHARLAFQSFYKNDFSRISRLVLAENYKFDGKGKVISIAN